MLSPLDSAVTLLPTDWEVPCSIHGSIMEFVSSVGLFHGMYELGVHVLCLCSVYAVSGGHNCWASPDLYSAVCPFSYIRSRVTLSTTWTLSSPHWQGRLTRRRRRKEERKKERKKERKRRRQFFTQYVPLSLLDVIVQPRWRNTKNDMSCFIWNQVQVSSNFYMKN